MPSRMTSGVDARQLRSRLAGLRRRLRLVVLWRGVGWLLTVVLVTGAVACLLDWRWPLPSLIRAVFLVSMLSSAGIILYRWLLQPLRAKTDDLSLALRIEERYPVLNDSLASSVAFLDEPADSEERGSASMRREAVRRALRRAQDYDFNAIVDRHGVHLARLCMVASIALAVTLILLSPGRAATALLRLANPFGAADWPRQTLLEIEAPRRQIGRNEPFDVRGSVRGAIPDKATVVFQMDGAPQITQVCDITHGDDPTVGGLLARLESGRVQRNFTFQVWAGDAVSERYAIAVLPPPLLVPLDGKASPQVRLQYPAYTDLPAIDLPEGTGNVEAVAGTVVSLRAAADRPLARSWIEFQPEPRGVSLTTFLAPLGSQHPAETLALLAGGQTVWDTVPAQLSPDRRQLSVQFVPRVSGTFALHFVDDIGLAGHRLFELRVVADPSPTVNLERPTPSRDSLALLPDAEFNLQVTADDPIYAVHSVALEYRCAREEPTQSLVLYDHQAAGADLARLSAVLTGVPIPPVVPPLRPRLPRVQVIRRVALKQIHHGDPAASPLKEGDVLTIQAVADDFDDVTVDKQPGRSHEIEIRIIGRNALDIALNKEQARIQQELVKLREEQRDALKKVTGAEPDWKHQAKLTPEEVEQLQQAEQLQQQIRERVGATKEEGLRADVARLLDTLRDNQVPRSAIHERMEAVQDELDRLAREELEQIQPRLTEVRKENELPGKKDQNLLTEARKHQEEVEKTLNDLLSRLEPWTSTQEIKGEARSILQEQRRLEQETEKLAQDEAFKGKEPRDLNDQQKAELERLKEDQQKLEERMAQLLGKMDRVSQERRKNKDEETARELEKAHQLGTDKNITGQMKEAQDKLARNQLNEAGSQQKKTSEKLEDLVKELEDRREAELDRLAKKLRDLEKKMDDLADQQDQLQKKVKEAAGLKDAQEREEALKKLGRQQEELKKKTEEMVQELKRLRAERASQALDKAREQMEQAAQQLTRGENPEEQQDEALDRLNEGQQELERARGDTEEELAREQLAKIADQLKHVKERQEGHVAETARIQREVLQRKGWDRGLLASLGDLARAQKGLGEETDKLAEDKLADAKVFARILRKASAAMGKASEGLLERRQQAVQAPQDTAGAEEAARLQQEALRRLEQLLEAIKQEPGMRAAGGGGGGGAGGGGGGAGGGGDGIPPLAELKLLRAMQADVNKRTDEFARQHPDAKQLSEKDRAALQSLRRDQQEVTELLDELTQAGEPEGDKR